MADPITPIHDCADCGRPVPECECDDCYHCGVYPCECEPEEDIYVLDDFGTYAIEADRYFDADYIRDAHHGGVGSLDVIARKRTKHGVGLGGYPWQRRINKTKVRKRLRRKVEQWNAARGEIPF